MHSYTCPLCGTEYFDGVSDCDAADCPGNDPTWQNHLPPDPENMNDHHAQRAAVILRQIHGSDYEAALADLLCDLMHWCDRNGLNFDDELCRARIHYDAETTPERDRCVQCGLPTITDDAGLCNHCHDSCTLPAGPSSLSGSSGQ